MSENTKWIGHGIILLHLKGNLTFTVMHDLLTLTKSELMLLQRSCQSGELLVDSIELAVELFPLCLVQTNSNVSMQTQITKVLLEPFEIPLKLGRHSFNLAEKELHFYQNIRTSIRTWEGIRRQNTNKAESTHPPEPNTNNWTRLSQHTHREQIAERRIRRLMTSLEAHLAHVTVVMATRSITLQSSRPRVKDEVRRNVFSLQLQSGTRKQSYLMYRIL